MRFLKKRNMKSWLPHWVAWLAGAPSLHIIGISRNQTLKLLLSILILLCSLNYTVHLLLTWCNMSFSYVVFFSFVCNSFSLFLFFFLNRYYQIYFNCLSPGPPRLAFATSGARSFIVFLSLENIIKSSCLVYVLWKTSQLRVHSSSVLINIYF